MVFGAVVDINQPRLPIGMKTPIFMGLSIGSGRLQGVGAAPHQRLDATAEPVHALREIVARRHEDPDIHCRKPLFVIGREPCRASPSCCWTWLAPNDDF